MADHKDNGGSKKTGGNSPKIPHSPPGSGPQFSEALDEKSYPRRVITFKAKGKLHRFNKPRIIVGSMISADIRIEESSIAPIHAVIEVQELLSGNAVQATIFDLASETGLEINGKKSVTHHLKPGDQIKFGQSETPWMFGVEEQASPSKGGNEEVVLGTGQKLFFDPKEDRKALLLQSAEGVEEIFDYRPSAQTALEVVMSWRGTILDVEHFVADKSVTIGESRSSHFGIPPILGQGKYALVTRTEGGFTLNLESHMSGVIQNKGDLRNIKEVGKQFPNGKIPLEKNDFAKISLGEVDFYLSYTAAPPRLKTKRFLEKDPYFIRIFLLSLLLNTLLIFILTTIPLPESIEAEKLPERVATVLYHPEKYTYPVRKQRELETAKKEPKTAQAIKPKASPTPRKTIKVEIQPSLNPKAATHMATGQNTSASKGGDKNQKQGSVGQSQSKEGQGAKAQGESGVRGTKGGRDDKTKQYYAERPSPQGGKGQGGAQSQVPGPGNLDVLKGASQKFLSLLGGSTAQLGKSGDRLKGFGAFNTQGGGGQALSGTGAGGGGQSTTASGLSDRGQGGGRVGTGLGAVGKGDNIVGGEVRVELRRGGPEESVIMGAIDRDAVEAALLAHKDEFRLCYEQEINQGSPNIAGRVTTSFVIGSSGRVNKSGIASTSLRNPNTERCILKVIQRIQFPIPMGGGVVQVKYPFKFRPVER